MLRYPSVERIERTLKRRTLNWIRRLPCTGTLLSGLKLRVQLAVGEIADFVLLDAILRGFLPDSAETSFVSQSYIYLETTITDFFVTSPFPKNTLEYTIFTLSAMGGPCPLWAKYTPLFPIQNNTRSILRGE